MSNKAVPRNPITQSDPRVPFAFERTLLAYERTQTNGPDFEKVK